MFPFLGATSRNMWRCDDVMGNSGPRRRFGGLKIFFPGTPGLIIGHQILHWHLLRVLRRYIILFVDEYFPKDVRASAQGLVNVMILERCVGGESVCPWLAQRNS